MDKMNGIAKKILIGVGVLFAILIIAGIAGNKQLEEKAKTEPVAKVGTLSLLPKKVILSMTMFQMYGMANVC